MFCAKNVIGLRRLSRFFSSHFGTIHSKCAPRPKIAKNTKISYGL